MSFLPRLVAGTVLFALSGIGVAQSNALDPTDEKKVRAVNDAYVTAWRKNDPSAATFWPDAVLIPHGRAAIKASTRSGGSGGRQDHRRQSPASRMRRTRSEGTGRSHLREGASFSTFSGKRTGKQRLSATAATT